MIENRLPRYTTLALAMACTLGGTAAGVLSSNAAYAESVTSSSQQYYDIAPGKLSDVLAEFTATAGVQLVFESRLANGIRRSGLQGNYTVQEGFATLLAGTNFIALPNAQGQYHLKLRKDGEVVLSTLQVSAMGFSNVGAIEGFKAENSVSAINVEAPLIETPASVSVLTKDFLDTIGSRQTEDALTYVAGAGIQSTGNPISARYNLRGFQVDPANSGGITVDGFRANRRGYHFDRSLYERIDVLKGASAVLYGESSPGGVINYISKRPQFEESHYFEATLGSFDLARETLDTTGPLNDSKTLAYRLVATNQNAKSTGHGDDKGSGFADDRLIVKPSITWLTPSDGELNISYEYTELEGGNDFGVKRLDDGEILYGHKYVGPENKTKRKIHTATIEYDQPLSENWSLSLGGTSIKSDNDYLIDSVFFGPSDSSDMPRYTSIQSDDHTQREWQAEINGRFMTGDDIDHQLTFGYSHLYVETEIYASDNIEFDSIDPYRPVFDAVADLGAPAPNYLFGTDPEERIYLQDYISIGDKLHVFAGISWLKFKSGFIGIGSLEGIDGLGEDEILDWNMGVIYNYSDALNPFFSYSTSTFAQRGMLSSGALIPSSRAKQVELGLKSDWFENQLTTTATIFQIDQTDKSEDDPNDPGDFLILAGDQRTRGLELEAIGALTDQVSVIANYSYLDAEFINSSTAQGNQPHSVPKHKTSLFSQYDFSGSMEGLSLGAGVVHVGERQGDNNNTFGLPSYNRVDLTLGYGKGPIKVNATLENVMDKDYISGSGGSQHQLTQGAPRYLTVSMGYRF